MADCPILRAGIMITRLNETKRSPNWPDYYVEHRNSGAECLKNGCVWYGNGCPAYPSMVMVELKGNLENK